MEELAPTGPLLRKQNDVPMRVTFRGEYIEDLPREQLEEMIRMLMNERDAMRDSNEQKHQFIMDLIKSRR